MNFGIELSKLYRGARFAIASMFVPALFGACSSSGGSSDAGTRTPTGNIVIRDENNFTATSSLSIPHVQTAPGADLNICWTTLSTDLLCHTVVPTTTIDSVTFLEVANLKAEQIQTELGTGGFTTKNVKHYGSLKVDHTAQSTCAALSSFASGTAKITPEVDYVESPTTTYMVLFAKGTTPGSGSRSMLFLDPTATSTNTSVTAPEGCPVNGSPILDFQGDITTPAKVSAPIAGPWVVDWSLITRDGLGNTPVIFQNIDSLLVAYYDQMTVAELQNRFRDMEIIATSLYKITLAKGARTADLATAVSDSGVTFPGFTTTNGVWAVALECSTCSVPAPAVVAILSPS